MPRATAVSGSSAMRTVEAGFLGDQAVNAAQERAAADERHAAVNQVGGEFRVGGLQGALDGVEDDLDRLAERLAHFLAGDGGRAREAGDQVAAFDGARQFLFERGGGADLDLDRLGACGSPMSRL